MEDFYWCSNCECVYPVKVWIKERWLCPTPGCDGWGHDGYRGGPGRDAWAWSDVQQRWPEYPMQPEAGEKWELHGHSAMTS